MKQCPECNRVYYDEKLNFCLDDGEWLHDAPDTGEPPTEMLGVDFTSSEARTRTFEPATSSPNVPALSTVTKPASKKNSLIAGALGILLVTALGLGSYWLYGGQSRKQINSIAVMPFLNEGGSADAEYLSDGMTDSLISSLSDLPELSVKARNSVFRYKGKDILPKAVGAELSVQGLVLGRVLQRGSDIALHIELVDTQSENVLWSSDYNRPVTNLVGLQSEIARDVATKLRAKLTSAEEKLVTRNYPVNTEAYELYLKGRYFAGGKYTEESMLKAIGYFNQALEKDPAYALAYTGLARTYMNLGHVWGFRPPKETFPLAKAAISKALDIDNTLAEAHAVAAEYQISYEWNWAEGEREIIKALELNPNDAGAHTLYGTYFQAKGQFDAAIEQRKKAREVDTLSPLLTANVGYPLYYAGRYDEAIQYFQRGLELDPNFAWSYLWIGQAELENGKTDDALKNIQKAIALSEGNVRIAATLGYAYAKVGNRAEAERIINQLQAKSKESYISPYFIAVVYSGLDEKDAAFEWLEKACDERHPYLTLMAVEPVFNNLHSDPRFQELKRRVGL